MAKTYTEDYPLSYQIVEYNKWNDALKALIIIGVLLFFSRYIFGRASYISAGAFIVVVVAFIVATIIVSRRLHHKQAGKLVLYANSLTLEENGDSLDIELESDSRVKFFLGGYTSEMNGLSVVGSSFSKMMGEKNSVENYIIIDNGNNAAKKHFFSLDKESHYKLLIRRIEEWKDKGYKVSWDKSNYFKP